MPKYIEKPIPSQDSEGGRNIGQFRKWLEEAVKLAKAKPGQLVVVNDELVGKSVYSSLDERLATIGEDAGEFETIWSREKTANDVKTLASGKKQYRYHGWIQIRTKAKTTARKS